MIRSRALLAFAATALATAFARAAGGAEPAGPLVHPDGPGRYRWRAGVGTVLDLFPKRVVQTSQYDTPQIAVAARLGLPADVSVDVRARTLLVSTQVGLGVAWSHRIGDVTLGALDHQGFAYGTFEEDLATASTWALVNEPGLALGLTLESIRLSVTGEAIVVFDQHTKTPGGAELTRPGTRLGGTALTFVAEDVFRWGVVYAGAGWMRTTADYLSWFAYSDLRGRVSYLRLVGGYAF